MATFVPGNDAVTAPTTLAQAEDVDGRLVQFLTGARRADGGWHGGNGRAPDVESAAWGLIASASHPSLAEFRDGTVGWLLEHQQPDGSWTFRPAQAIATWVTLPATFALAFASDRASADDPVRDRVAAARQRATHWMLDQHSVMPSWWQQLLNRLATRNDDHEVAVVLDATLDGYGWAAETFAWVEPTAVAIMALSAQPPTAERDERIGTCVRLLLDRQAPDGGWNYGNKRVLGYDLPGFADTTAWALLGLQAALRSGTRVASVTAAVARGAGALRNSEQPHHTPLALSLALLAVRALNGASGAAWRADRETLVTVIASALDDAEQGYPLLDTRSATLALLALGTTDVLVPHG